MATTINKAGNEYASLLGHLYDRTPKAVFAAIAISALTKGGDELEAARVAICSEWATLHHNGIVPQKPPNARRFFGIAADAD